MRIRLGTRSSRLALWQANTVAALLVGLGVECEIVPIETRGDDVADRPLPEIGGDGVFTERIERALRASEIDIAVHSLKDLPVVDPDELCVGAVLGREEVREVLVSREGRSLAALPSGATVGSSSTRRQAQLLAIRRDLVVRPIRGNVETRIRKVESGEYDATLLAGAGVLRLGLTGKIAQWMELSEILPAPGQGALAVQCRTADRATRSALAKIDEPALHVETDAERGFLRALGGGCSAPVGAFAQTRGPRLRLRGRISALDGSRSVDVEDEGEDHAALVAELAARALREGAADLIAFAAKHTASHLLAGPLGGLRVLVTRGREQAGELCARLAAAGAVPVAVPLIGIAPLEDTRDLDAAIERLASYHWLVFASANGVKFFMKRLEAMRMGKPWTPGAPRVAAVGPGTAEALRRHGISVDLVPAVHTGIALAEGILGSAAEGLARHEGAHAARAGRQGGGGDPPSSARSGCRRCPDLQDRAMHTLRERPRAPGGWRGRNSFHQQLRSQRLVRPDPRRRPSRRGGTARHHRVHRPVDRVDRAGRGVRVDVEAPLTPRKGSCRLYVSILRERAEEPDEPT